MSFGWTEPISDIEKTKQYKLVKAMMDNNQIEIELLKEEIENGRTTN
jgi:hypothetical protein